MTHKVQDDTKKRIAEFLPDVIAQALNTYHEFATSTPVEADAKKFAAQQAACKAAVAHIELLVKLARWAELPDPKAPDHNRQIMIGALVQEAQAEIEAYNTDSGEDDE